MVVVVAVASFLLGDPAGASRADADRRVGRAVAARVADRVAADPGVNQVAPELAVVARALADGRMAHATHVAERMVADPPPVVAASGGVGAAQIRGSLRATICQLVRSLQVAFAGFPSVSGVFVSLLSAFGCGGAPSSTTTISPGTSTTVGPSTTMGGPTTTGPTTTLPPCIPNNPQTTTVPCQPPTTMFTGTSTTVGPSTTMGGPTTTGPTTTLPPCIPNNPQTTTVPCQPPLTTTTL